MVGKYKAEIYVRDAQQAKPNITFNTLFLYTLLQYTLLRSKLSSLIF
jgi:hypothetical protein